MDFRLKNPEETFFANVISGLRAPDNRSCFVTEGALPGWHTVSGRVVICLSLQVTHTRQASLVANGRLKFRTTRYLHTSGRDTWGLGAVDNTVSSKLRIIPKGEESGNEVSELDFDSTGVFDGDWKGSMNCSKLER